jgi:hypothetical protein
MKQRVSLRAVTLGVFPMFLVASHPAASCVSPMWRTAWALGALSLSAGAIFCRPPASALVTTCRAARLLAGIGVQLDRIDVPPRVVSLDVGLDLGTRRSFVGFRVVISREDRCSCNRAKHARVV